MSAKIKLATLAALLTAVSVHGAAFAQRNGDLSVAHPQSHPYSYYGDPDPFIRGQLRRDSPHGQLNTQRNPDRGPYPQSRFCEGTTC
jgi:hypothetical protein